MITPTKVKFDGKVVAIAWLDQVNARTEQKVELESREAPAPSFGAALEALKPMVLELLELDAAYGNGLRVQSVSINKEDDGRCGAVVTSLKLLEHCHAPLVLNTPHLRERVDEETEKGFLPQALLAQLRVVQREAREFINGKREQRELPLDGAV